MMEQQLESWNFGVMGQRTAAVHYSITPILHHSNSIPYRQCSLTQLTISIRLANQTSENDLAYLIASS